MLKGCVSHRDEELRRKDHIIAALTERIPELEPAREEPREARESPRTVSEEPDKDTTAPDEEQPSWWKRFFGFQ